MGRRMGRRGAGKGMAWLAAVVAVVVGMVVVRSVEAAVKEQCPGGKTATSRISTKRMMTDCLQQGRDTDRLSPELGDMVQLTHLDLSAGSRVILKEKWKRDRFEGSIPTEIGLLVNLEFLDLSHNRFTGPIPSELANLQKLDAIVLQGNRLTGTVPREILAMPNLRFIGLHDNNLNDTLNGNELLASAEKLEFVGVSGNPQLQGELVTTTALPALRTLKAGRTQMTALDLPEAKRLEVVEAEQAQLTKMPQFWEWSWLRLLDVSSNPIAGTLKAVDNLWLPFLREVNMSRCSLSGEFSILKTETGRREGFPSFAFLEVLDISHNDLTGPFVQLDHDLDLVREVFINDNKFTSVNTGIEHMKSIQTLEAQNNEIVEVAFDRFGGKDADKTRLEYLNMSRNSIQEIPRVLRRNTRLEVLDMSHNNLSGQFPSGVTSELDNLRRMFLQHNQLSGKVPSSMSGDLVELHLQNNKLEGKIPTKWAQTADRLQYLNIANNGFTGSVPENFSDLERLETLHIFNNPELGGTYPFRGSTNSKNLRKLRSFGTKFQFVSKPFLGRSNKLVRTREFYNDGTRVTIYLPSDEKDDDTVPVFLEYDESKPGPPSSVTARRLFENEAQLIWSEPEEPNGRIIGYLLTLLDAQGRPTGRTAEVSTASHTFDSLRSETSYQVVVQAGNAGAGYGDPSAPMTFTTQGGCPTGFQRIRCANLDDCDQEFIRAPDDPECIQYCSKLTELENVIKCRDSTFQSVEIRPGFYRISDNTLDIRPCPKPEYCSPEPVRSKASASPGSGAEGGRELVSVEPHKIASKLCSPNHRGIFCWTCEPGYGMGPDGCELCDDARVARDRGLIALWSLILLVLFVSTGGMLVFQAVGRNRASDDESATRSRRGIAAAVDKVREWNSSYGVRVRIVVGFYQVYFQLVLLYNLLDNSSRDAGPVAVAVLFNFDFGTVLASTFPGCAWEDYSFKSELLVYTLLPLGLSLFWVILALCVLKPRFASAVDKIIHTLGWLVFNMAFLIYPGVSFKIFKVFLFDSFSLTGESDAPTIKVLRDDFSVEYGEKEWIAYASVMIVVYPVGIIVLFAVCMYLAEKYDESRFPFAHSIEFLREPYNDGWKSFELLDLGRKLALTSGFLLLDQYYPTYSAIVLQATLAMFYVALKSANPYDDEMNRVAAEGTYGLLFILTLLPVANGLSSTTNPNTIRAFAIIIGVLPALFLMGSIVWDWNPCNFTRFCVNPCNFTRFCGTSSNERGGTSGETSSSEETPESPTMRDEKPSFSKLEGRPESISVTASSAAAESAADAPLRLSTSSGSTESSEGIDTSVSIAMPGARSEIVVEGLPDDGGEDHNSTQVALL